VSGRAGRLVAALLLAALGACAHGPLRAPAESATVYIYRSPGGLPGPYPKTVFIDGKSLGLLVGNGYFKVQLAPGEHVISTPAANKAQLTLRVVKGVDYYVSQEIIPAHPPYILLNRVRQAIGKPYVERGHRLY
jgi:hypothetical protein